MKLVLSEQEVKEAIAAYINNRGIVNASIVTADQVCIKMRTEGKYDEVQDYFDGVTVELQP